LWYPLVFTISVFLIILRLGGPTKSCIKMKQKEQIKIARDLILNGLSEQTVLHLLPVIVHILTFPTVNILREENVPEDKIPKSMNYKSYHSKIVEQCGVVLVGYPGEKGIVNPGELDALMLKELLLRLGDGRCHWGKSPGHVGDADALPSPSSSSSWTSSDSAYSILGSRQPMEHETGTGSHTSPEASSVPAESGRKSTPNTFNLDSDSMAARSWPIKSEMPSMDSQHCFPFTKNFSAPTTAPTLPTPSHMVPRRYNTFLSPTSNKANNSTSIPDSTMMLSNAFLRSPPPTPQHDLQSVAFHTPPLVLDELPNHGSPHSSNPDLDLNFPRQPSYSPFQTSTDFLFSNHKAGCNDFDMADGTLPVPNTFQDIFSSPSFAIGLGVHGGQSGPLWPSSTIQPHAPWVGHMWDIQI